MNRYALRDIASLAGMVGFGFVLAHSGLSLLQHLPPGFDGRQTITVPELEYLIGIAYSALGLLLLGWVLLGAIAASASVVLSRLGLTHWADSARRLAPGFMYRLLAVALGGSLVLAPAAQAAPVPPETTAAASIGPRSDPAALRDPATAKPSPGTGLDSIPGPGWQPQHVSLPLKRLLGGSTRDPDSRQVVVRRGDSLWTLAQRELGQDARMADVARAWPRWYETNRRTVGPDPDLLEIGTVLEIPARQRPEDAH
ncbi:LysM peptidoglycan-binding domain-containing protein [Paeniglutamicibacter cryotolerans]|uniref:LysM domain-containing protein n=1 Tax=Paeniglutamicibacter cryotolerans TaxID=670079 RepID=A0A839QX97_9MICC|nr:hypothetical protein [Paeniglutamicibacter cryotolerans]MBB2996611.1 hypothetical protein [Paeniglutamicibacter cryotolerans]